jgi:uncharacterized protein (DUF1697 family)
MNAAMPALREAFEAAGFRDVRTLLSSGNVLFTAPAAALASLERKAEAAMQRRLGRTFLTIVRPVEALREALAADPYRGLRLAPGAKRVITFLRAAPPSKIPLPVERDGVRILTLRGNDAFSAYVRNPKGPVFMTLIEKTFGKEQTTRTWETVTKVAT